MKIFKLLCFFFLSHSFISAAHHSEFCLLNSQSKDQLDIHDQESGDSHLNDRRKCHRRRSYYQLGSAGKTTMDPAQWYSITTFSYPSTVPLSLNRNRGFTQGHVSLTPSGLMIGKSGNYSVSFTAIVLNNNPDETPLIPVFLIRDGLFIPTDTSLIASVGSLHPGLVTTIQGTGILENVEAGTTVSLVATNGGSQEPQPITVIGWDISLFKIPADSEKKFRKVHRERSMLSNEAEE